MKTIKTYLSITLFSTLIFLSLMYWNINLAVAFLFIIYLWMFLMYGAINAHYNGDELMLLFFILAAVNSYFILIFKFWSIIVERPVNQDILFQLDWQLYILPILSIFYLINHVWCFFAKK